MVKHQFTREERSRGGKKRVYAQDGSYRPDFIEMCEEGYQALQFKRPGVAMWVYEQKVKPHMQSKKKA